MVAEGTFGNGGSRRSTPQLVRSIASDTATLARKEIELARQEIVEGIVARVKSAAMLGVAAVALLLAVIFLASSAAAALDRVMEPWASRVVVAGGFLFIAGVAAAVAMTRAKSTPMAPEKTVETVKEDIEWAKAQLKR